MGKLLRFFLPAFLLLFAVRPSFSQTAQQVIGVDPGSAPRTMLGSAHEAPPALGGHVGPLTAYETLAYYDRDSTGEFGTYKLPDVITRWGSIDYTRYAFSERFTFEDKGKWYMDSATMFFRVTTAPSAPNDRIVVYLLRPYVSPNNGYQYPYDTKTLIVDSAILPLTDLIEDDSVHGYTVYFHHKRVTTPSFFVMLSLYDAQDGEIAVLGDQYAEGQSGRDIDTSLDRAMWTEHQVGGDSVYFGFMGGSYVNSNQEILYPNFVFVSFLSDPTGGVATLHNGQLTLQPSYPSIASNMTTVDYEIASPTAVNLTLRNTLGEEVASVQQGLQSAGKHSATFNVRNLPAGSYFYTLHAAGQTLTKSLIVSH